jgi:hypothetical protein
VRHAPHQLPEEPPPPPVEPPELLYYALVNELIPEGERARANGALQLLDSIPRSGGPYVTGVLMSLGNMSLPFYITAALYGSATATLYALMRGRAR